MMRDDFLTVAEAADLLNVSTATVRRLFDAGKLRGFRIPGGEHRRVSRSSIVHLVQFEAYPFDDALDHCDATDGEACDG